MPQRLRARRGRAAGAEAAVRIAGTVSPPDLYAVRGLVKRYGDRTVLDGIDFTVGRGECFVILGRSGTGKSVTLRQLNGLDRPDAGEVIFDGQSLTGLSERQLAPLRRRVAMLFQGGALFDSLDVFENIAFPLREHSRLAPDEIASKVREKLALVHLAETERKMPSELSGGMKKRVALARSLALDPEVVLFDEPTTGLDPITSATIGALILATQRHAHLSAVVVTHDLPLARLVADRIGFLDEGRFRFIGTFAEADASDNLTLRRFLRGEPEEMVANTNPSPNPPEARRVA